MEGVVILVAIIGSAAALFLRPPHALAVYVAALFWFPDYLKVGIGSIDMSVGRIIVVFLLLRCLSDEQLRKKFVWSPIDTWVSIAVGAFVVVYCAMCGFSGDAIENRGGLTVDTFFAYISARLIITDKEGLIRFIKITGLFLVPLALYGIVEAITGWQPLYQLVKFRQWRVIETTGFVSTQARWGFTRAVGPFSHPILFGECFVLFLPVVWALRHQGGKWRKMAYLISAMVILGALSSMSSGPWGALIVVVCCLALEKYKQWTKHIIVSILVLGILAAIISNRSLHHVILSYLNIGQGDWYQRARLIDAAVDTFNQWWLAGYGDKDPGWGSREGGYFWGHFTDMNNQFLFYGIQGGIWAVIGLCGTFVAVFRGLSRAGKQTNDIELKSLYWSMGCCLVGVIAAWQGVSLFGQSNALFYSMLGVIGSSVVFIKHPDSCGQKHRHIRYSNCVLAQSARGFYMK